MKQSLPQTEVDKFIMDELASFYDVTHLYITSVVEDIIEIVNEFDFTTSEVSKNGTDAKVVAYAVTNRLDMFYRIEQDVRRLMK